VLPSNDSGSPTCRQSNASRQLRPPRMLLLLAAASITSSRLSALAAMADPGQAAADAALKQAEQARNSARDRMMADIGEGACATDGDDASSKTILVRGCDPVMAERAGEMLPPLLGGVTIEAATQDDVFFELLSSKKYDAVFFAPGACRWSAARKPIPGGNAETAGWSLDDYRIKVSQLQPSAKIVETCEERDIVPLLRQALGLR
jgi:hypothetical protein